MAKLFTPSSTDLINMIKAAEARFAADREQALLRKEAREDDRVARAWAAEAEAISRHRRWGC
jgi:hypothetical protein